MIEQMKEEIVKATKQRDDVKKNILKLVVSEVQTREARQNKPITQKEFEGILKLFIKNNNEIMFYSKNSKNSMKLMQENAILSLWLPRQVSGKELQSIVSVFTDKIKSSDNTGQAIGLVIKGLTGNYSFDNKEIKSIIEQIRNE